MRLLEALLRILTHDSENREGEDSMSIPPYMYLDSSLKRVGQMMKDIVEYLHVPRMPSQIPNAKWWALVAQYAKYTQHMQAAMLSYGTCSTK